MMCIEKMATGLTIGSVPQFYREVYDIVCPNQDHVNHDMFVKLLVKSSLPKQTLSQIWEAVDNKQGFLTRNGLYKALAFTALAQQGKSINDKLLENYSGQELPQPSLGDLTDLKAWSIKVRREQSPNVLGYSFEELCDIDSIKVELVPGKKGIILKHNEYEVTSRRYKRTVHRRYNDFIALQELLLVRFPYRMIPKLPPKKMMGADRDFIEQRRKCLRRFLTLIVRHPKLTSDEIVKYFLTFDGSDMLHKIKEYFKGIPDEFMTNEIALKSKDLVPIDTQLQFGNSREHIRALTASVGKLRDIAERNVLRSTGYASDMLQLGTELSSLSSETTAVSAWASGTTNTWAQLKRGFKHLSVEYTALADRSTLLATKEEESVVEILNTFLALLLAYRELCERHEKGVLQDHQRALQKLGQYKKRKMSATVNRPTEPEYVDQLEQRILEQENEISNMENRNFFSLHCVQMETQLIHANLESLHIALQLMAQDEAQSHSQVASVWAHIRPIIDALLPSDLRNGSACTSPKTSPLGSPSAEHSVRKV